MPRERALMAAVPACRCRRCAVRLSVGRALEEYAVLDEAKLLESLTAKICSVSMRPGREIENTRLEGIGGSSSACVVGSSYWYV